jgi:lipopolysaccharide biosynthesis glycosyltransferase
MQPIDVVVAADAPFCRQLAVTISGISRFGAGAPHRIFVFHDGYDDALRSRVEQSATNGVGLHWVEATSSALRGAMLPDYLPEATLYRLRIADLLPDDIERVLFLDTDVVVRGSLADLWDADLEGALLGAVRDAVYPWAGSPECLNWRSLDLQPDTPYFNAGVMVIPLDRWRSARVGDRALRLLRRHTLRYGDQCALNAVAAGEWKALPPHWNVQSGHLAEDSLAWIVEAPQAMEHALGSPTIVHYTWFQGRRKPWEPRSASPYRDLWFEELDRTAWTGWRPDDSAPSRARVRAARARRAGGVLIHGN